METVFLSSLCSSWSLVHASGALVSLGTSHVLCGMQAPRGVSRESSPMAQDGGETGTLEQQAMVDVVISSLGTLGEFPDDVFKTHMKDIFPLMTRLIRCRAATVEMQVALSNLFAAKLGPV